MMNETLPISQIYLGLGTLANPMTVVVIDDTGRPDVNDSTRRAILQGQAATDIKWSYGADVAVADCMVTWPAECRFRLSFGLQEHRVFLLMMSAIGHFGVTRTRPPATGETFKLEGFRFLVPRHDLLDVLRATEPEPGQTEEWLAVAREWLADQWAAKQRRISRYIEGEFKT